MKTKREIREIYNCQKAMNRITDILIQKAIDQIGYNNALGVDDRLTAKNIIDTAYDLQYNQ